MSFAHCDFGLVSYFGVRCSDLTSRSHCSVSSPLRACVRSGSSARTRAKRSWSRRKSEKAGGVLKHVEDLFRLTTQIHGLCSRVKPERLLTRALSLRQCPSSIAVNHLCNSNSEMIIATEFLVCVGILIPCYPFILLRNPPC